MEQLSFLNDFPDVEEEKRCKLITTDASGDYDVFAGGTYIYIKNKKGQTVRFTGADVKQGSVTAEQIEGWLSRLHKLYHNF